MLDVAAAVAELEESVSYASRAERRATQPGTQTDVALVFAALAQAAATRALARATLAIAVEHT